MVWQLSPLVRCCLVPSLFETSVSTFPSFHDTPAQENITIPSPDAGFYSLSNVLHSVAISLVLTTSVVKKLHTPYTPGPVLTMAIINEDNYVGKQTWRWNWGAYETHHTWCTALYPAFWPSISCYSGILSHDWIILREMKTFWLGDIGEKWPCTDDVCYLHIALALLSTLETVTFWLFIRYLQWVHSSRYKFVRSLCLPLV